LELCDSSEAVGQMAHLQLTHRHRPNRGPYRRDLRRLPQELRQDGQLCSLLILTCFYVFAVDLDLASKRTSVQTPHIATWVQAERR
ncbi:hypothetical protein, partial [Pseudomonas sp. Bc-h]|uniref:hypothetical protein n=1 Tax=Pseudomonas sp. Bc-h TaxID=1943632 RepID=UPI001C449E49